MKTKSAMQTANYILHITASADIPVTNIQLQYLLLFSQIYFYQHYDSELISDKFIHYQHSPAIQSVYSEFNSLYGSGYITEEYTTLHFTVDNKAEITHSQLDLSVFKSEADRARFNTYICLLARVSN